MLRLWLLCVGNGMGACAFESAGGCALPVLFVWQPLQYNTICCILHSGNLRAATTGSPRVAHEHYQCVVIIHFLSEADESTLENSVNGHYVSQWAETLDARVLSYEVGLEAPSKPLALWQCAFSRRAKQMICSRHEEHCCLVNVGIRKQVLR